MGPSPEGAPARGAPAEPPSRSVKLQLIILGGAARSRLPFGFRLRLFDVDGCRVQRVLEMDRVMLLDHLHAGTAVFGNLVDVRAFHEAHTDIGVAQAVGRARFAVTVELQLRPVEQVVEQLDVIAGEEEIGPRRIFQNRRRRRFAAKLPALLSLVAGFMR